MTRDRRCKRFKYNFYIYSLYIYVLLKPFEYLKYKFDLKQRKLQLASDNSNLCANAAEPYTLAQRFHFYSCSNCNNGN